VEHREKAGKPNLDLEEQVQVRQTNKWMASAIKVGGGGKNNDVVELN